MKTDFAILGLFLALSACGGAPENPAAALSKEPISVRGWIADVDSGSAAPFRTVETEAARKASIFAATSVEVENAPFVSGGVAENGSFVLLDVPPGKVSLIFTAPGAPKAHIVMERIPGNADVFLPGIVLRTDSVLLGQPAGVQVRMGAKVDHAKPTGATALVAGATIPIVDTPLNQMNNRRDFPTPPGTMVPLATVR